MQLISGPGVGLPYPQNLYPSELNNSDVDAPTNLVGLAPGDAIPVPSGRFMVDPGPVGVVQWLDPVTGIWRTHSSARGQPWTFYGDGFTRRVANLTGCAVAAVVAGGGTGRATLRAIAVARAG